MTLMGHVYVIAEIGVNHNGNLNLAKQLVQAAAKTGADAVKFQTFQASSLVTATAERAPYQEIATGSSKSQLSMLQELELTKDDYIELKDLAQSYGVNFLSTPFDEASALFLYELGVGAIKVGSGDLTNLPLLRLLNSFGLPVLLSTGMSNLDEVKESVECLVDVPVTLLHCTSSYPAPLCDINLLAIRSLSTQFGVPVGYSDHSNGFEVSMCAVALGARVIEKHITMDRNLPGPDHRASLEPDDFSMFVSKIRDAELFLGDGEKRCMPSETATRIAARKSIVMSHDVPKGKVISRADITIKRPGTGLLPRMIDEVVGRSAKRDLSADTVLQEVDLV